jgi:hypothetical protein
MATRTLPLLATPADASPADVLEDGTISMKAAQRLTSLGRIHLYRLMGQGRLAYVKLGNRRLIVKSSLMANLVGASVAGT